MVKSHDFSTRKATALCYSSPLKWTNTVSLEDTKITTMTGYFNELYQETHRRSSP